MNIEIACEDFNNYLHKVLFIDACTNQMPKLFLSDLFFWYGILEEFFMFDMSETSLK